MRKIYLTLAAAALTLGAFAQTPKLNTAPKRVDISGMKNRAVTGPAKSTSAVENFYVDYSAANFDDLFFVWTMNSGYTAADTAANPQGDRVNPINYAAVGLTGPLQGYYDATDIANTLNSWDYYYNPITIDSVFAILTHENNSGQYDKIYTEIVTLDASLKPTGTVLWSAVDSSNTTLSPGGNYVGTGASFVLSQAPAFTTTNNQKIGFNIRYIGSKLDTFTIIGGAVDNGTGQGTDVPSNYPNSWTRIPPNISGITKNANIGYGSPVGADGWFEAQNWSMWAYVTYNVTGVSENEFIKGVKIGQSFPNPADKATRFFYELQKPTNVTFQVFDVNGRLVKEFNEGVKEAGKHTHIIDLASFNSGVYFYTIKTDATTITKRFVVTK